MLAFKPRVADTRLNSVSGNLASPLPCRRGVRVPSKPSLQLSCLKAPLSSGQKHWASSAPKRRVAASASMAQAPQQAGAEEQKGVTMNQFLTQSGAPAPMILLMQALQTATKIIASKVACAGIEGLGDKLGAGAGSGDRDAQKKLDVVANEVLKTQIAASNVVGVMASEEDDEPCVVDGQDTSKHIVVFDPLDGSSNISASIPTGTIVGVYTRKGADAVQDVLQPGENQVAAAYSLYSSATMMVVSLGSGTHGFTLLPEIGEFILTHPNISIPSRGQMYSLNDARQHDWPAGLRNYITKIQKGEGQSGKQYSARYICSLVADFHRTLLYGGWAGNPRSHLRLVYEANPLSYLCEQAGGRGSDGVSRILSIPVTKLHQRLPFFAGSPEDISELESSGDVQQVGTKKYDV